MIRTVRELDAVLRFCAASLRCTGRALDLSKYLDGTGIDERLFTILGIVDLRGDIIGRSTTDATRPRPRPGLAI